MGYPGILVIGGAGGVGSIAIQLARALTDLTVITTASRPETSAWVKQLGAHHVVDHGKPLAAEVAALGIGAPAFVFSTTQTDRHFDAGRIKTTLAETFGAINAANLRRAHGLVESGKAKGKIVLEGF